MTDIEGGPAPVAGPWSAPTPTLNWSSPHEPDSNAGDRIREEICNPLIASASLSPGLERTLRLIQLQKEFTDG